MTKGMRRFVMVGSSGMGPMLLCALIAAKSNNDSATIQAALNTGIGLVLLGIQYTFAQVVRKVILEAPDWEDKSPTERVQ